MKKFSHFVGVLTLLIAGMVSPSLAEPMFQLSGSNGNLVLKQVADENVGTPTSAFTTCARTTISYVGTWSNIRTCFARAMDYVSGGEASLKLGSDLDFGGKNADGSCVSEFEPLDASDFSGSFVFDGSMSSSLSSSLSMEQNHVIKGMCYSFEQNSTNSNNDFEYTYGGFFKYLGTLEYDQQSYELKGSGNVTIKNVTFDGVSVELSSTAANTDAYAGVSGFRLWIADSR